MKISEALPEDDAAPLPGAVLCTLVDAVTGDPVTGAALILNGSVSPTTIQEATYGFPYVFGGGHSLQVDAAGYAPRVESLEVYAAETTKTTVYLNLIGPEGEGESEGEPPAEGETEVSLHVTGYPGTGPDVACSMISR